MQGIFSKSALVTSYTCWLHNTIIERTSYGLKKTNVICGILYRQHDSPESFQNYFESSLNKYSASGKQVYILEDFKINLLKFENCKYANDFLLSLQSYAFTLMIDKPTRVHSGSATLIDNILVNQVNGSFRSGNAISYISDHFFPILFAAFF